MDLFIETENGAVKNHPAYKDNLVQAFGCVPKNWEPFNRVERPVLSAYQVLESNKPVYVKIDGVWTDVWSVRELTAEEKTAKQQAVITGFNERKHAFNWSSWTFDETTCTMQPPIPRPEPDLAKIDAGIHTFWCGAENNWKEAPAYPRDNKLYRFDVLDWEWLAID